MSEHTSHAPVTDPGAASFDVPAFALGAELSSLRAEARELWVPDHERASRAEIARLVGRALSMVVRALELVDIAAVLFGGDARASGPGSEDFGADERDQRSWSVPTTPEAVASLAERARRVLRVQGQRLCTPHAGPDAEVRQPGDAERLVAVAAGMRWIERTFRLLEEALCGAEPVSPPVDSRFRSPSELLEQRKSYVGFQRQVLGEGMLPGQEELGARLRSAGIG
ncbi:MAG: hypothetical protein R3B70_17825, partial [Polyangiaceae bacterium]